MTRYEPRRAAEPAWPYPWWVVRIPVLMVALLVLAMVLEAVRGEPVTWGLLTPIAIHLGFAWYLPFQKRQMESRQR